ncbi:ABC transporter substrate-binding protein [Deinococcus apachensis]|uniref:ABC transporter substrate-binding protein n=1 Tax=Deinococcus apachensis TaxID=309886 RepID=UPI0003650D9C|nr:ABC transporter substrate-binding protein [Deinococcus apachensis]
MKNFLPLLGTLLLGQALAAGTLVYGAPGEPVNLNPGNASDSPSLQGQVQIYDRLVHFKPGTATPVPGLATAWKSNANATQWTFTLRQNVKFHDGTPFNADAVIFNVNRWWDPKNPYRYGGTFEIWGELMGGYKGQSGSLLKSISKVNANSVRFTLSRGVTAFPDLLGTDYFGIASPTAVKKLGAKYGTPASGAVGTGPFRYVSWRTGDRLVLKPSPNYWGTRSTLDQMIFRFIKDPSQRLNELRAGTVDFTSNLDPQVAKSIKADPNLRLVLPPAFNVGLLNMNVRNKALSNTKVREAIRFAVNRPAIVDAFWGDLGATDNSLLPPALNWANSKDVPKVTYNPAVAKRLLAEAGYPNGFSVDLWYMPISRSYFPQPKPVAEAIAADLGAIGIKVNLRTEDWAKYLEDRQKGRFDLFLYGWSGDYSDPDNFYSAFYGDAGSDDIGFDPGNINALLGKGRAALDRQAKARVYAQLQELTYNANVRLPIVHSAAPAAARTRVKNWITGPLGTVGSLNLIRVEGK